MATPKGAQRYLNALKAALVQGVGWKATELVEDVVKIAHVLRVFKLSSKLACSFLCIIHPTAIVHIMLKIEEAPHHSILKLKGTQAIDLRDVVLKGLQGANAGVSHVTDANRWGGFR